jgi:hypothetical protein
MKLDMQVNSVSLKAARQKYLQLGREIEKMPFPTLRSDLEHTHSKLGIFLEECFGSQWRFYDKELTDDNSLQKS